MRHDIFQLSETIKAIRDNEKANKELLYLLKTLRLINKYFWRKKGVLYQKLRGFDNDLRWAEYLLMHKHRPPSRGNTFVPWTDEDYEDYKRSKACDICKNKESNRKKTS